MSPLECGRPENKVKRTTVVKRFLSCSVTRLQSFGSRISRLPHVVLLHYLGENNIAPSNIKKIVTKSVDRDLNPQPQDW